MTDKNLNSVLATAKKAAKTSGELLKKMWETSEFEVVQTTAHDVKLSADLKSEANILKFIREEHSDDKILAEESGGKKITTEGLWVIDPLDGTVNFSHGHPHFCVSIAYQWNGETQVGVIYDPVREELFSAVKGQGAFCNNEKISVSKISEIRKAMITTGFGAYLLETDSADELKELSKAAQKIRISGSAALDLAYVASGRVDAYIESQIFLWDIAAGVLIVEEAGGKSSVIEKENGKYYSCTAANNLLIL